MSFREKIILGSAQFGMNYGISNNIGNLSRDQVYQILNFAKDNGVKVIDTAPTYGNAEDVLRNYPNLDEFDLITKFLPIGRNVVTDEGLALIDEALEKSLHNLSSSHSIHLLVHKVSDLLLPGGNLYTKKLKQLKEQKLIKIGISIYNEEEFNNVMNDFIPDFVQLPLNIFDHRLVKSGFLKKLKKMKIEIHVRSCFLQGLVFIKPKDLPVFFHPIKSILTSFHNYIEENKISPVDASLSFINSIPEVDKVVVGVTSAYELSDIINFKYTDIDLRKWEIQNELFVNPSMWKR